MGLDFDLKSFIEDMRACKPPYKCPFPDCGKVYKTFSGINLHIQSHESGGTSGSRTPAGLGSGGRRSPAEPKPFFKSPQKDSITFNEAEKVLEFEADGFLHALSIFEPLEVVSKEEWESMLPPEALEPEKKLEEPKTPASARIPPKKGKKTPKASSTKIPDGVVEGNSVGGNEAATESKKMLKLPEAQFKEVEDYEIEDAPPMPLAYYRFIEKSSEDQDEEVEYDMDEEDVAWLNIINQKRAGENLQKISEDQFELLMDRLEKESYFHVQTNGKDYSAPIDDDAICCVCMDGECSNTNVILFCDLCNLAVHQECYGVPYIPEGQWLCRRCLQSPSRSVKCCLCPNRGGAFKQTDDGRWAHVVCGLWIPEARFANTVFLEPIDSIDHIPPARWKLSCRVCKQRGVGACIQCHKTNCYTAFHVTCGLLAGLHMKMDTVRESSATGLSVTVRKTAYCDVHTPSDSDCKPKLDDVAALGIATPKQKAEKGSNAKKSDIASPPLPVLFRGLMNFSPQCPWEKVQEIASLVSVQKKSQFFQRLMAYWTLKRQTRNGVPLIRRLQFAKASRPDQKSEASEKKNNQKKKKSDAPVSENRPERKDIERYKNMKDLRRDLERLRLLTELTRKREQRKREIIIISEQICKIKCFSFIYLLNNVMDSLQEIDTQEIFAEPVNLEDVPDYLSHIKHPMDFRTMRDKLNSFEYNSLASFEADFNQLVENCLVYNEKETIYYRAGVKMRDSGGIIIRQAARLMDKTGFDMESGTILPDHSNITNEVSDELIMKEIDLHFSGSSQDDSSKADNLNKLLSLHDKAMSIHHPVAKSKRLKLLKHEIAKERRRISMHKAGTSPGFKKLPVSKGKTMKTEQSEKKSVNKSDTDEVEVQAVDNGDQSKEKKQTGRKRKRNSEQDSNLPPSKRQAVSPEDLPISAIKGVNRRNAVLFTKKKKAIKAKGGTESEHEKGDTASNDKQPLENDPEDDVLKPKSKRGRKPKPKQESQSARGTEKQTSKLAPSNVSEQSTKNQDGKAGVGQNQAKTVKCYAYRFQHYRQAECETDEDDSKSERNVGEEISYPTTPLSSDNEDTRPLLKKQDQKKKPTKKDAQANKEVAVKRGRNSSGRFKKMELSESESTETSSNSDSSSSCVTTSDDEEEDDDEDEDDDEGPEALQKKIGKMEKLNPLDLVWAKCRGYPWYPALIIDPDMPRTGYSHNGVPIPSPPQDVLDMAATHSSEQYLILFFDLKRTWQWLTRDKLEPLGKDAKLDMFKLTLTKKPSERKALKKAYNDAIAHSQNVTG